MVSKAVNLADWIGRSQSVEDRASVGPADILSATFDCSGERWRDSQPLPPAWHWLYFHEAVPLADTGYDGHPATGGFLPPVPLPRRMWAGNRMVFHQPVHFGERISRTSTVVRVDEKSGKSGRLCFVTVRHEVCGESGLATSEEHDIVYREAGEPGAGPARSPSPPGDATCARQITPGAVLLFRFSALTMNSHRIHYDRKFCVQHEGYPGLVFHGPLTMLLLLELFRSQWADQRLSSVSVRATSPLYDDGPIRFEGVDAGDGQARLWAVGPSGALAMQADACYTAY